MVLVRGSLALLLCLVYVPHITAAFIKRSGHSKRFGEVPGSRRSQRLMNNLSFRDNGFEEDTVGAKYSSIVLECQVGGTSNPTIHWLKDGERIVQGYRHTVYDDEAVFEDHQIAGGSPLVGLGQTTSRLFIDCLTEEDEGAYTCVAENPVTRKAQTTFLTVEKRDKVLYSTIKSCHGKSSRKAEPARIYMNTASRLEYEGSKIQLYCRTEGYPAPIVSWYDVKNEPITEGGQFKIARNGDLIIDNLSWFDNMGVFTCVAENAFGTDSTTTFVYPVGKGGFLS